MATFLESLFANQNELWLSASESHPFLTGCADSTISNEQFNTWLVQDYLYVNSFQPFLLGIIPLSPSVADTEILASGQIALENELAWFKDRAKERGLQLSASPLPTTATYKQFMETLSDHPYSIQIAILYLVERVYQRAWEVVLEKGGKDGLYRQFAQNWGNEGFKAYVDQLEVIAAREIKTQEEEMHVIVLFEKIMKLEVMFWDMAFESDKKC